MANEFAKAEGRRIEVVDEQRRQIKQIYKSVLSDIESRVTFLQNRTNVSSILRVQYLSELKQEIMSSMGSVDKQVEDVIKNNMLDVANAVVTDNGTLLKKMGYSDTLASTSFLYVPRDVVNEVALGKLYEGRWSLSKAIWQDNALKNKELETIIAKGIAENKSTYDIAKDLEQYVNPSAKKDWAWSKVYPSTRKVIDYNAQRLARTMVSHAYEESFVRVTKDNPFIEAYKWLPSYSDRMCPLCQSRGEDDRYGLGAGVYPKDSLPLDHPNGMCTFSIVMTKSYEQIADELADWAVGQSSGELGEQLDNFASELGYNVKDKIESESADKNAADISQYIDSIKNQDNDHMFEISESMMNEASEEFKDALNHYSGIAYKEVNEYLRNTARGLSAYSDESILSYINNLQKGMENMALPEAMYLRRGTDIGELAGLMQGNFEANKDKLLGMSIEQLNDMFAGVVSKYDGFTSTTSSYDKGFRGDIEMIIYAPKGTNAAAMSAASSYGKSEMEVLLNAGTTIKINKIEESDGHKYSDIRIYAEILTK